MVFYFTGTGNSGYAARRIADGLGEPLLCLNDRIKAGDTAPVETGERLVIVTPTYAWRIPRIVEDWLLQTELTGAKRAWFVMTCGSEIGDADRYNRRALSGKRALPVWARHRSSCRRTTSPCSTPLRRRRPGRSWPERSRTLTAPSPPSGPTRPFPRPAASSMTAS